MYTSSYEEETNLQDNNTAVPAKLDGSGKVNVPSWEPLNIESQFKINHQGVSKFFPFIHNFIA